MLELDSIAHAQKTQERVERLAVAGLWNDVDGRVDQVRPPPERMRIAARTLVAVEQQGREPELCEVRRGDEPTEPRADDDGVVPVALRSANR
jgi:hypothetical protein